MLLVLLLLLSQAYRGIPSWLLARKHNYEMVLRALIRMLNMIVSVEGIEIEKGWEGWEGVEKGGEEEVYSSEEYFFLSVSVSCFCYIFEYLFYKL